MSEYRTHTCNELREADAGKEVKLSGFVKTIRDLRRMCIYRFKRSLWNYTAYNRRSKIIRADKRDKCRSCNNSRRNSC